MEEGLDLLVGELLAEVGHHVAELGGRDEAVPVLVEHLQAIHFIVRLQSVS